MKSLTQSSNQRLNVASNTFLASADPMETSIARCIAEDLLDTALADIWRPDLARAEKGTADSQHGAA